MLTHSTEKALDSALAGVPVTSSSSNSNSRLTQSRHRDGGGSSDDRRSKRRRDSSRSDADSDVKPESSWAKLELLASTTSLSGKQSVAAELRSDRLLSRYERIDRIAMYLFPIFFFLFNVCYWSYYLLLDDVLQDLW